MIRILMETFKRVRAELKAEIELKKQIKELARLPLNYELIQNVVNAAALQLSPVEIEIHGPDYKMVIKPHSLTGEQYKTFREKYDERNK